MNRFPPKKILVALDHSAISAHAWRHAAALADRFGAALEIVYVEPWETAGVGAGLPAWPGLTPGRARKIRSRIRAVVGDAAKVHIVEGDPAGRILRMARAVHAGLIVMGSHGRAGPVRFIMGSVAEGVLRSSPVPVLVARGPAKAVDAVLAPVNFTPYSKHGFAYAAAVAAEWGARLTALHVGRDSIRGGNPLLRINLLLDSLPPAQRAHCEPRVVESQDPAAGILRAAAKHDLIVLVAHKKSPVRDLFLGTTAERLLRRSKKPILAVPPPREQEGRLESAAGRRHSRV